MNTTATPDQIVRGPAPCLGRYVDARTRQARELTSVPRPDGSVFVLDRLVYTGGDERVVAHLATSEPPENASIIAEMYLADGRRGRCRPLSAEDLTSTRAASPAASTPSTVLEHAVLPDDGGYCFRLHEMASTAGTVPELRWTRSRAQNEQDPPRS